MNNFIFFSKQYFLVKSCFHLQTLYCRNANNDKYNGLEELEGMGIDVSIFKATQFRSGCDHSIVSNKVGANKIARRAAKQWTRDVEQRKLTKVAQ